MTFGERVRMIRLRRGLSQYRLAQMAGVSRQLIYYLERGERDNPTIDNATAIAKALNVSLDYLVGMYEEEGQDTELQPALAS
jgi:transcriptional regulator with XRE-family HTH domain